MTEVRSLWSSTDSRRIEWEHWYETMCPKTATAEEYALSHGLQIPFQGYLLEDVRAVSPTISAPAIFCHPTDEDFQWPENVAIAGVTVQTGFCRNPGPSRMYLPPANEARLPSTNRAAAYYEVHLASYSLDKLRNILKYRMDSKGKAISISGSKQALVKSIRNDDERFLLNAFRTLLPDQLYLVQHKLATSELPMQHEVVLTAVTVQGVSARLTAVQFCQLRPGRCLDVNVLSFVMLLFRKRDERICRAYAQCNYAGSETNRLIDPSLFLYSSNFDTLKSDYQWQDDNVRVDLMKHRRVFFPIQSGGLFSGLVLDMERRTLHFVSPEIHGDAQISEPLRCTLAQYSDIVNYWVAQRLKGLADIPTLCCSLLPPGINTLFLDLFQIFKL